MSIKQLSVFVENKAGKLKEITDIIASADIDIRAMSIADTKEFGILRVIVNDIDRAKQVLEDDGLVLSVTDVLGIRLEDRPGGLASIMGTLSEIGVNIEYMYAFLTRTENAYLVVRVADAETTGQALEAKGIMLLTDEDIKNM
ncbi:MAG: ACT domain-containing protein [Anaerovoracaceae bacterium]|nr:ACT domain-containing protein [Anaerovoracaceae bacterium]